MADATLAVNMKGKHLGAVRERCKLNDELHRN